MLRMLGNNHSTIDDKIELLSKSFINIGRIVVKSLVGF